MTPKQYVIEVLKSEIKISRDLKKDCSKTSRKWLDDVIFICKKLKETANATDFRKGKI